MREQKIKTVEEMEELWEAYKDYCNNQSVLTHDFSAKNSEFVSAELKRSITYTIEGFCVFIKLPRRTFYENYADNPRFLHIVMRMREECEIDARKKFELGTIPTQLAGLWMSKHGYTTRTEDTSHTINDGVLPAILEYLKNDKAD